MKTQTNVIQEKVQKGINGGVIIFVNPMPKQDGNYQDYIEYDSLETTDLSDANLTAWLKSVGVSDLEIADILQRVKYLDEVRDYPGTPWVNIGPQAQPYVPNPIWEEPDWKYRIFVSIKNMEIIADQYPEMLIALNQAPANPKYKLASGIGAVIYLNNITDQDAALLGALGIIIENRP